MEKFFYKSILEHTEIEIPKIKWSRFIWNVFYVKNKEEAENYIKEISDKYRDFSTNSMTKFTQYFDSCYQIFWLNITVSWMIDTSIFRMCKTNNFTFKNRRNRTNSRKNSIIWIRKYEFSDEFIEQIHLAYRHFEQCRRGRTYFWRD